MSQFASTHEPALSRSQERRQGFTIVEILVAMGLTSIVALGLATVITNSFKGQKGVTDYADFNTYLGTINLILSNPTVCANAFQNDPPVGSPAGTKGAPVVMAFSATDPNVNPLQPTPGYSGIPVERLALGTDGPPSKWDALIEAGKAPAYQSSNGWLNQLLITQNYENVTDKSFIVNLRFSRTYQAGGPNGPNGMGGSYMSRDIPMLVETTGTGAHGGGPIVACSLPSGRTSCLPTPGTGWMVVNPGTAEAFCIQSSSQPAVTWPQAIANCAAITGGAHLCGYQEWIAGCLTKPANFISNTVDWMPDVGQANFFASLSYYGNPSGTCLQYGVGVNQGGTENYRCCMK